MKNLNIYGESFTEKVKEEGKLEYINDYYQVDNVSVTQSQTNHLINVDVVTHSEEIYRYNNEKYKLDIYSEIECNELFTIPLSYTNRAKEELIENFVEDISSDIHKYESKEITETEYNRSGDMSIEEVKGALEDAILSREKAR